MVFFRPLIVVRLSRHRYSQGDRLTPRRSRCSCIHSLKSSAADLPARISTHLDMLILVLPVSVRISSSQIPYFQKVEIALLAEPVRRVLRLFSSGFGEEDGETLKYMSAKSLGFIGSGWKGAMRNILGPYKRAQRASSKVLIEVLKKVFLRHYWTRCMAKMLLLTSGAAKMCCPKYCNIVMLSTIAT